MIYFSELEVGDAFQCLETCYIKISDKGASNAICLHNGHSITFTPYAGVKKIELQYKILGVDQADEPDCYHINRR